jgi:MoxR-like ATPase
MGCKNLSIQREENGFKIMQDSQADGGKELIQNVAKIADAIRDQVERVIVGQRQVVDDVILGLFAGQHIILSGVPGLAKTLLIRTLARALSLDFSRIQFTPDLMPSDITGSDIIQESDKGHRSVEFLPGPVFTNLLLADEINRTPPKTQAAMLQVMQEHEVSVGRVTHALPDPFHVFATKNPIEMEGTYGLPEAAADRFMLSIDFNYPSPRDEVNVVRATTGNENPDIDSVIDGSQLADIHHVVRSMPCSEDVLWYAVRLVGATRPGSEFATSQVKELVRWGASPRASQNLILGAKARAVINGDPCANFEGVRSVAKQVLNHRVLTNFKARATDVSTPDLIDEAIKATPEMA